MSRFADVLHKIVLDTDEVDPNIVARKAREQILGTGDLELIAECWAESGNDYARQVLGRIHTSQPDPADGQKAGDAATSALARRMAKVSHPVFMTRVCIAPGDYIALGDATRPQLRARAEYLRHKAAGHLRNADAFDRLADKLKSNKAPVSSLDGDLVAGILTGGA